jgi:glycosyltransferase involved in cell wall biosynthesis
LDGAYNFSSLESAKLNLIYNACDAFLFPSLKEGYGRPLVEAMASGLPAVVSDIQVFREICGRSAIFVEPTKDGCLLGLKEALNNPEQIGKEGLTRSKMFSRENFINEVRSYYLSIADQRGP